MPTPEYLSQSSEWGIAPSVSAEQLGLEPADSDELSIFKAPITISANLIGDATEFHARIDYPMDAQILIDFLNSIAPRKGFDLSSVRDDLALLKGRTADSRARIARHMRYDGWPEFVPHGRIFLDVVSETDEGRFLGRIQSSLRDLDVRRKNILSRFNWMTESRTIPDDHPVTITIKDAIAKRASESRNSRREKPNPLLTFSHFDFFKRDRILKDVLGSIPEQVLEEFVEDCIRYEKGFVVHTRDGQRVASMPYNSQAERRLRLADMGNARISAQQGKWYVEGEVEMEGENPKFQPDMATLIRHRSFVVPHLIWRTDKSENREIDTDALFETAIIPSTCISRDDSLLGFLMLTYFEESLRKGWEEKIHGQVNGPVQVPVYASQRKGQIAQKTTFLERAEQHLEAAWS